MTARVAAATLLSLLAGCATLPPPSPETDWSARREALQSLDAWTLDGRIAVAAGEEGFSGGLRWSQAADRADISVSSPIGGKRLAIRVDGSTEWRVYPAGTSFEVAGKSGFDVRAAQPTGYFCEFL